jgi:nucleotide-binding universal stress UspA family protein
MFNKVVWATDGSNAADRALPHAKVLVTESGGELVIVHCEEWVPPGGKVGATPAQADEDEMESKVELQAAGLAKDGLKSTLRVVSTRAGGAAHAIADVAREEGADVIVVGTRGRTVLGGLLLGGVTQRLLHITPCPVLAVPAGEAKASG